MTGFTIAIESPLTDDVRSLIRELNEILLGWTPEEFCSHMTVEEMAAADTTVFVARHKDKAAACGALKRHGLETGEVKRMYTRPEYRGRKLGRAILDEIEALARQEGRTSLVLETGHRHEAAWRVYEGAGFARCGPVLDYPQTAYSVFYRKALN